MFKLRHTVRIGPHTYRLRRTKEADSSSQWAFTSDFRKIVGFGEACNPREMPATLIHELVHIVTINYGVHIKEREVTALSNGLTQALQDLRLLPREMDL